MNDFNNFNFEKDIDYKKIGLKCGIEIHQQLDTKKLFCSCPCEIVSNDDLNKKIYRKLRFSLSETGKIDKAALEEFRKQKYNTYIYNDENSCLVELDEQPPSKPNKLAIETALKIGIILNLNFFDKIQFMRKLIINGSVTSGFQRTAMLGLSGILKTSFKDVKINAINIEEDAGRIISRLEKENIYALDRQGIPLIEITTAPDMKTPNQVYETAYQLGNLLRSFQETKRGIGTIRQDLNISIKNGARVEIKGAQNLKLIPQIVKAEVQRQINHISIIEELKKRGIHGDNLSDKKIYEITDLFKNSKSKVIIENIKSDETGVFAIKLNKFKEILGYELNPDYRFATEISNRNKKRFSKIKGLFHSDELPKYGITQNEVNSIFKKLKMNKDDSFILIANKKETANNSLKYIFEIIEELIIKVPEEVRQVDPKGTLTVYSRPMPGSARMYPETDVPIEDLKEEYIQKLSKKLPEIYDEKILRLQKKWNLEQNKIEEILNYYTEKEFDNFLKTKLTSQSIYSIIFDTSKDIKKRENIETIELSEDLIKNILELFSQEKLNRKLLYKLFMEIYKDKKEMISDLEKYLKEKKIFMEKIDENEINKKIKRIIKENPKAPINALIGLSMKEFKGQVDGKLISEKIRELKNNN